MTYIAEIENNKIINEFKKAVKKTGKSESDVLVQLMAKIAVTGVTGNLGGMVSRLCKENGIKVRNLARNKEKA